MSEINLTESNFEEEVLKLNMPVLVDFWADWCGPCQMLAPAVKQIADENTGKIKVCKVNVDDYQALAIRYGVVSIPTVVAFNDGKEKGRKVGFCSKEELMSLI